MEKSPSLVELKIKEEDSERTQGAERGTSVADDDGSVLPAHGSSSLDIERLREIGPLIRARQMTGSTGTGRRGKRAEEENDSGFVLSREPSVNEPSV